MIIFCYCPKNFFRLIEGQQSTVGVKNLLQTTDPWITRPASASFFHGTAIVSYLLNQLRSRPTQHIRMTLTV